MNTFEYFGKRFTPIRNFNSNENTNCRGWIDSLGILQGERIVPHWDWADFYEAATEKVDIYRCENNGKYYVPCGGGLMECTKFH